MKRYFDILKLAVAGLGPEFVFILDETACETRKNGSMVSDSYVRMVPYFGYFTLHVLLLLQGLAMCGSRNVYVIATEDIGHISRRMLEQRGLNYWKKTAIRKQKSELLTSAEYLEHAHALESVNSAAASEIVAKRAAKAAKSAAKKDAAARKLEDVAVRKVARLEKPAKAAALRRPNLERRRHCRSPPPRRWL